MMKGHENHIGNPCAVCGFNSSGGYSINGVWFDHRGTRIAVNGNNGIIGAFSSPNLLWSHAFNNGRFGLGSQFWRNLSSTGNLTWSGQQLSVTYNASNPNISTGTGWSNYTFTMNTNGQTLVVSSSESSDHTWTRTGHSLIGVWEDDAGTQISYNGNIGIIDVFNSTKPLWLHAFNNGRFKVGSQFWRSLSSTGYLTWSGQQLHVTYNASSPDVSTGTGWSNYTFTMSTDGQTLVVSGGLSDDVTWTRKQ